MIAHYGLSFVADCVSIYWWHSLLWPAPSKPSLMVPCQFLSVNVTISHVCVLTEFEDSLRSLFMAISNTRNGLETSALLKWEINVFSYVYLWNCNVRLQHCFRFILMWFQTIRLELLPTGERALEQLRSVPSRSWHLHCTDELKWPSLAGADDGWGGRCDQQTPSHRPQISHRRCFCQVSQLLYYTWCTVKMWQFTFSDTFTTVLCSDK